MNFESGYSNGYSSHGGLDTSTLVESIGTNSHNAQSHSYAQDYTAPQQSYSAPISDNSYTSGYR